MRLADFRIPAKNDSALPPCPYFLRSKKKKPSQKEVQAALSKKINAKQEAIKKKEAERKKAFPILVGSILARMNDAGWREDVLTYHTCSFTRSLCRLVAAWCLISQNVVKDEDKSKGSGKAARSLRGQR